MNFMDMLPVDLASTIWSKVAAWRGDPHHATPAWCPQTRIHHAGFWRLPSAAVAFGTASDQGPAGDLGHELVSAPFATFGKN